jgi:hypothetical protein
MIHSDRLSQNFFLQPWQESPCGPVCPVPASYSWQELGQINCVLEKYKAQMREEEERRKLAIEAVKLEIAQAQIERKAVEEKAVQKYRQTIQEQKEAGEKAVLDYQKSEQKNNDKMKEKEKSDLLNAGFSPQQVAEIMDPKPARICPGVISKPGCELPCIGDEYNGTKTRYIRVHRDYICVETLSHYHISWKYDDVRLASDLTWHFTD